MDLLNRELPAQRLISYIGDRIDKFHRPIARVRRKRNQAAFGAIHNARGNNCVVAGNFTRRSDGDLRGEGNRPFCGKIILKDVCCGFAGR